MDSFTLSPVFCAHNGIVVLNQTETLLSLGFIEENKVLLEKVRNRFLQWIRLYSDGESKEHYQIDYSIISQDSFLKEVSKKFAYQNEHIEASKTEVSEQLYSLIEETPIINLLNSLILECAEKKGSDIHFEPFVEGVRIKMRILGELVLFGIVDSERARALVLRILFLAGLDISEMRKAQDGSFHFEVGSRSLELRVSALPTLYGLSVVVRLLDSKNAHFTIQSLGFNSYFQKILENVAQNPSMLFLLCGATGAGKSTTLAAILQLIASMERKIITIEDPIEYRIDGVVQVSVNKYLEMDFSDILPRIFRHDPDVIMIGEIRDEKTAQIAVRAALTGHLVLASLHTVDAPSAVVRLLDLGIENYLLASVFGGSLCQRLIKIDDEKGVHYVPVAEILPATQEVQELILKRACAQDFRVLMDTMGIEPIN